MWLDVCTATMTATVLEQLSKEIQWIALFCLPTTDTVHCVVFIAQVILLLR